MKRLVLGLLVALSAEAAADADGQSRANELFTRGQARYDAGDYRQAIALFDEAYQLVRDPVYLFNIAQSYRRVFDCVPAAQYFERYLAEATDADDSQRTKVKALIAELSPCLADRKAMRAPAPIQDPAPEPAAPVVEVEDRGRGQRLGGIALAGAGAVGLVLGAVYSAKGADIEGQLADCAAGCQWTPEREALDRDGSRANTIATISWIAGGAAVAGGAVLYFLGRSKRNERRVIVAPLVHRTEAAAFVRVSF